MTKLVAPTGKVYDYATPQYHEEEDGTKVQDHLYGSIIYVADNDSVDNYKLVKKPN